MTTPCLRRTVLALVSFCAGGVLSSGFANAQPRAGQHPIDLKHAEIHFHSDAGPKLTLDQLKEALTRHGHKGGAESDPLQEMLKQALQKNAPTPDSNDAKFNAKMKQLLSDPKIREQLKGFAEQVQKNSGAPNPRDISDFLNRPENASLRDQLKGLGADGSNAKPLPPGPTKTVPTPNQFPDQTSPARNPAGEPGGQGVGKNPWVPGANENQTRAPGGAGPPAPPSIAGPRMPPNDPFGPSNPFGKPADPDPRAKSMAAFAAMWEQTFGPLDETPELRKAIFDLSTGSGGGLDFDWNLDPGSGLGDLLNGPAGDGSGLEEALTGEGGDWKFPSFELPTIGWGSWFGASSPPTAPSFSSPQMGSGGSSWFGGGWWEGGGVELETAWLRIVLLVVAVLGGVAVWWYWLSQQRVGGTGGAAHGLGPWPVDPHAINSREDVVKAFEYVSVLLCGPVAKMWTHRTIAQALADLSLTQNGVAGKLARLYELARYAPLEEPLSRTEVFEARHLVCDLAGV